MIGNPFYRTTLEYWKASTQNYTWYWVLAVFFGWAGLDMFYLRSPIAGVVKALLSVFTLGFVWFYDAIQATFNKDQIQVTGPISPFYGPLGIAGGMFMGAPGTDEQMSKHAHMLLYGIVLIATGLFGGDSFLVGDKLSGYIRILALVTIFFAPIAFVWWFYKLYLYFIRTDQLLDQNYEYFGAPEPADASSKCPNVLEIFTVWAVHTAGTVMGYIPFVGPIGQWLLNLSLKLKDAYGMVKSTVESVQKVGPAIDTAMSAMKVQEVDIEKAQVQAQAQAPPVKQAGGYSDSDSNMPSVNSSIFIVAIGAIIVASFSKTFWSVYNSWKNGGKVASNDNQREGEISDEPPQPDNSRANASGQTPRAGDA
jgi:TM2 domain-containing membrane protein YozV